MSHSDQPPEAQAGPLEAVVSCPAFHALQEAEAALSMMPCLCRADFACSRCKAWGAVRHAMQHLGESQADTICRLLKACRDRA